MTAFLGNDGRECIGAFDLQAILPFAGIAAVYGYCCRCVILRIKPREALFIGFPEVLLLGGLILFNLFFAALWQRNFYRLFLYYAG